MIALVGAVRTGVGEKDGLVSPASSVTAPKEIISLLCLTSLSVKEKLLMVALSGH